MTHGAFELADLPWLPRLDAAFREHLRAIERDTTRDWGPALRWLANQHFGMSQALALAQALDRLRDQRPDGGLDMFRLGLAGNSTIDFLRPMLVASALRHGICLEVTSADFGQCMQEAINPESRLNRAQLDAVLLLIDHHGLPFRTGNAGWPLFDASAALSELEVICRGFRQNSAVTCFVQTIPAPAELLFGSLDVATAGTLRGSLAVYNAELVRTAGERGNVLIDTEWLANCIGLDRWHDDRQWHVARVSCSQKAVPLYADFICRAIAALRGKSRKCLILDLDNTLWGGVIGDDGLDGIALNLGDPRGEVYRAIQQAISDLRTRGVLLAVCSKNDDAIARQPFREHNGMILKESDISAFYANWDDKATNIQRIAHHLNLGIDAMVLLDDNAAERAQVRQTLPQVAVPELREDPSTFVRTLLSAGYFESVAITPDDLSRVDQYRLNAERMDMMRGSRDLSSFLRSLQMEIKFAPFSARGRKRITQLVNKTNQFNLTTRRYTERQIEALEESADHYTLQVSLKDRFGDNGMICVLICVRHEAEWEIDTWLMSCRVLNRKVEHAVCNRLAYDAQRAGVLRVVGNYMPTERNSMVRDLLGALGFTAEKDADGGQRWVLDLQQYKPFEVHVLETPVEACASQTSPS